MTAPLDPNSTYQERSAQWQRYTKSGFRVVGVLKFVEARKPGAKAHITPYIVTEIEPVKDGRRFQVHTPLDPEAEVYYVQLEYRGPRWDSCTCKGWTSRNTCKHATAIRKLAMAGHFPKLDPSLRAE